MATIVSGIASNVRMYLWAASFVLGSIPLLVHWVIYASLQSPTGWSHNWSGDVLFINISVSSYTILNLAGSYIKKNHSSEMPLRSILLIVLMFVSLVCSAAMYSITAAGLGSDNTIKIAIFLLTSIVFSSFVLEYDLSCSMEESDLMQVRGAD